MIKWVIPVSKGGCMKEGEGIEVGVLLQNKTCRHGIGN